MARTRVIDTPISEAAIVGAAVGAAYMGMRPVAEMQFMDFVGCAFDMMHELRREEPLPLRPRRAAGRARAVRRRRGRRTVPLRQSGSLLPQHPGLRIVEPSTAYDAKGLLKAAIRDDDPVLFLEHKFLLPAYQG